MESKLLREQKVFERVNAALERRRRIEAITNLYLNSLIAQDLIEDLRVYEVMREIVQVKGYNLRVGGRGFKFTRRAVK